MQNHGLFVVGRWMIVTIVVAACGCSEGQWGRTGANKSSSKDKPATKARRPLNSEAEVAQSKSTAEPTADDTKSHEVDEKVDRYVRSMEPPSDADRAAPVRETEVSSRTEPIGSESVTEPAETANSEPSVEQSNDTPPVINEANPDVYRHEITAQDQNAATPAPETQELTESDPPSNLDEPYTPEEAATTESVMKPPVLSQVIVEPSSTLADAEPLKNEPASPATNNPSREEIQSAAGISNEGAEPATATVESPADPHESTGSASDGSVHTEAVPVQFTTVDSPSPQPVEEPPAEAADHNATEATSNAAAHVDTPVELPPVEAPEPKEEPIPPATLTTVTENPNTPARPATDSPSISPPSTVGGFKNELQAQEVVVAENPDNVEEQFKLRMLYLVNGQDEKALAPASGLDAETQEIMLGQLRAVQAAGMPNSPDPAIWAYRQLDALEKLRGLLRSKADLLVPKVELCRAIDGFGRYEPFNPLEFKAGAKNRVLLYIEVDNFRCETTASGMFRTLLSVRESLMNKSGEELWSAKDDNIEDLARAKRRDFYLTIGPLAIPKTLAPGEYVFKVEVEDVLGGKINSNVVRFKMVP